MIRRAAAALGLAVMLCGFGVAGASAAPIVPPSGPGKSNPLPNPVSGAAGAILDKLCPPRVPPYPQSPNPEVVNRGGGPGGYAKYGYGGLTWTTYDEGCLAMSKADTSLGSEVNQVANSIDVAVNELQATALDPESTDAFAGVVARAVKGLHDAFWNPWALTAVAVLGLLTAIRGVTGRASEATAGVVAALVVLGVMFTVLARPRLPIDTSNAITTGVARSVATSLVNVTPGQTMPKSASVREKFTEGYYQVSYRAWLEGWSCGDAAAERRYGARLRDAQSFTAAQTQLSAARQIALVDQKNAEWLKIGEEMKKTDPVAFACWKGAGVSRLGAAAKHLIVSLSAGFWVFLGSIGLLALRWMLMIAILFGVTFGPVLLFSRRMQDRMIEFAAIGLLGPAFVAVGVGTLLWGYYAILLDRGTSWWMSGVFAFALGLALFLSKGILQRMFTGLSESRAATRVAARGGRHARNAVTTVVNRGTGAGTAAAIGGLAGYGASEMHDRFEDGRREASESPYEGFDAPRRHADPDGPGDVNVATDSGVYEHADASGPAPTVYDGPTSTPAAHDALYRARRAASEGRYDQHEADTRNRERPEGTGGYEPGAPPDDRPREPEPVAARPTGAVFAAESPTRSDAAPQPTPSTPPSAPGEGAVAEPGQRREFPPEPVTDYRSSPAPRDAVRRAREARADVEDGRRDDYWDMRPET